MPIGASIWGPIAASAVGGYLQNRRKSSTTPTLNPAFSPLQSLILKMTMARMNSNPDLSGYRATGIEGINRTFGNVAQSQNNDLTARGLSTSPVAASVDATRQNARAGQVAGFENQIPLLARQLQGEDLASAGSLLNFGRGSTTTEEGGGGAAGAATNLAQMLGYYYGKGAFGQRSGMYTSPKTNYAPSDTAGWG